MWILTLSLSLLMSSKSCESTLKKKKKSTFLNRCILYHGRIYSYAEITRQNTRSQMARDFETCLVFRTWCAFRDRKSKCGTLKGSCPGIKKNIKDEAMWNQRVHIVFIFRVIVDSRQQRLPTPYSANRVTLRGREVHIRPNEYTRHPRH